MITPAQVTELYTTAERAIRRTLSSMGWMVSADDMEDLKQGVALKLLTAYDPTRGPIGGLAWRVASNDAADFLRGRTVGAIKNDAKSLESHDEDGNLTTFDIADDSSNPRTMLEAATLDRDLTLAIDALDSGAQRKGIKAFMCSEETSMSGADRIAKLRAVDALTDNLKASHMVSSGKVRKAKAAKKAKRDSAKVSEVPEIRGLLRLQTLTMWNYITSQKLVVIGPMVQPATVDEGWTEAA